MKYQIYQINLTEKDELNERKLNVYRDISFRPTSELIATHFNYFNKVAIIDANDLDDAFAISNLGEEEELIERLAPMHSLSVGDVLIDEDNNASYVATFGFYSLTIPVSVTA